MIIVATWCTAATLGIFRHGSGKGGLHQDGNTLRK
jgi:hypothetical protein